MKIILKNIRISYPDIFTPGKKFGKYGAQFRFNKDSGVKEQIEKAIEDQGLAAFPKEWEKVKKNLVNKGKLFRINDGEDKGYEEDYFISVHNAARPHVVSRNAEPLSAEDGVIYSGCRVDAWIDVSAYEQKEFGPVVSVKLLAVQFRADDTPYSGGPAVTANDFTPITDGADAPDL